METAKKYKGCFTGDICSKDRPNFTGIDCTILTMICT